MIVGGDAPPDRGCALACAPCSSAGPATASAAPVRRMLRRSIRLPSAVGWLTICPSIAHRSHALRSLKIEAWLWPPVKETGPRAYQQGAGVRSDGSNCQRPRGLQEANDEAFDCRLGGTLNGSAELFGTRFLSKPAAH